MVTNSKACLLVFGATTGNDNEWEVNVWWTNEHLAERLQLPGFNRARRYYSCMYDEDANWTGAKYLALYDITSIDDLTSPEYMHALNNPTDNTRKFLSSLVDMQRSTCFKVFEADFTGSTAYVMGNQLMVWSFVVPSGRFVTEQTFRDTIELYIEETQHRSKACILTCVREDNNSTSIGSKSASYTGSTLGNGLENQPTGQKYFVLLESVMPQDPDQAADEILAHGLTNCVRSVANSEEGGNVTLGIYRLLCVAESR